MFGWLRPTLILLAPLALMASSATAQQTVEVTTPDGKKIQVPADKADEIRKQMAEQAAPKPGAAPSTEKKPEGAQPAQEKAEGETKPSGGTKRPTEPTEPADPKELEVRPADDGRVAFAFRNQPWPALLEWLAEISEMPLDWQELPSDFVNLASPGRYTVEETRDLFNRHLLARGYTMLLLDGGITVVKTEAINPALVPRVEPTAIASLTPYSFVRTSIDCGWLLAPKLAEELKPMISTNGRLVALEQTNRLEAMDAAINLQQLIALIEEEQSSEARSELAREFELRHLPAEEAKEMLAAFLGVKEEKETPPMSPQQIQQMQQQMQRQAQQNGGNQPKSGSDKEPKISIVVNNRRNSLLINAPPDRMAIAAQFIVQVDVPGSSMQSLADIESRVQVFRLTSLDPEKLAEIARDMNILEPSTRLRVDEKNKALIVSASAADRFVIQSLIDRLDGSARSFEVLQLRRLDAQAVAESIMFLMGTEKKDDSNNRRSFYYSFSPPQEEEDEDKFRVAANVHHRQVLLWANEHEMEEVRNLLVKLGEIPPDGGSGRTMRVIEASATPETYEYLQRLKEHWQATSPTELQLPEPSAFVNPLTLPPANEAAADEEAAQKDAAQEEPSPEGSDGEDSDPEPAEAPQRELPDGRAADRGAPEPSLSEPMRLVSNPRPQADPQDALETEPQDAPTVRSGKEFDALFGDPRSAEQKATDQKTAEQKTAESSGAAIRIEVDESGNLILLSDDTAALDRLESMMLEVEPPQRPYTVFRVRHASATWMMLNLDDYFADTEADESDDDDFSRWFWGLPEEQEEEGPSGLGKTQPLRFVADDDTGSIVVTGATTSQLKTIGELIELWDVPEPLNKSQSRFTRLVQIRFSQAEKIAETVKDAYRDLLSSNDKAFSQGGQRGGANSTDRGTSRDRNGGGSSLVDSEGGRSSGDTSFTFRGKLSIGVDTVGNTLLVSAEGEDLLEYVCEVIDQLDQAASPQGDVEIREIPGTISVDALETALRAFAPQSVAVSDRGGRREPADRRDGRDEAQPSGGTASPGDATPQGTIEAGQ